MQTKFIRALLLLYGLLNAALYCSLLPLWEGFDEEFHYGYVQYLDAHARFPVLGQTGLSEEINQSIDLLPMSYIMRRNMNINGVRTFDQYTALDSGTRREIRQKVEQIPPGLSTQESPRYIQNYEVHHAPLSYFLMAIPNGLMSQTPLLLRVLWLRLMVASSCVMLMFWGTLALGREAGLDDTYAALLVFLIFSCQMFWATVAHVCNDWLAIPLAVWTLVWAMRYHREPSLPNALRLAVVLALGLLTKAYFLVFVPLYLVAIFVWFRRGPLPPRRLAALLAIPAILAGPWYIRNLSLYGNLSGRLEESSGVTMGAALRSLASIPWLKSFPFMARGAFWMGNASFTDFSVSTMNALLLALVIALLLYCRTARREPPPRVGAFLWTPVVLFGAAMIYVTGSAYTFTKGSIAVASPWYLQAVMTPLLSVALLGCRRSGRVGRYLATATLLLWGYILAATYIAKLFPLYGGFAGGRSTLRDIAHWYIAGWPRTSDILGTTAMVPAPWLAALLVLLLLSQLPVLAILLLRLNGPEGVAGSPGTRTGRPHADPKALLHWRDR